VINRTQYIVPVLVPLLIISQTALALHRLTALIRGLAAIENRDPPSPTLGALEARNLAAGAGWVLGYVDKPVCPVVVGMRARQGELRGRIMGMQG
jgi:hypothetical protein